MEERTKDEREAFGNRLEQARKGAGFTQPQVAEMFDKTKQAVSSWEKGRNPLNSEELAILVSTFHVSADWLLLGRPDVAMSAELAAKLAELDHSGRLQAENLLRTHLGMRCLMVAPITGGSATPGSRSGSKSELANRVRGMKKYQGKGKSTGSSQDSPASDPSAPQPKPPRRGK